MIFLKKSLQSILGLLARKILVKYKPEIIGITGSVGKTSTKEAIFCVLKNNFRVRKNEKNYNNELGVPLTVIDAETKGKSIFGWLAVFIKALKLIIVKDRSFPEVIILEMGADHPGDVDYLTDLAPCRIGVFTSVGPTHLEFFGSVENIRDEKKKIVTKLPEKGWAILNRDDAYVWSIKKEIKSNIISYGLQEEAQVKASDVNFSQASEGISFKLNYQGSTVPVFLPKVIARVQVSNVLAAAAVGLAYNLSILDIVKSLSEFETPRGRTRLIKGIKNTTIIDDTYNASPKSMTEAISTLNDFKTGSRKIAVLGDMLELGNVSEEEHYKIGQLFGENKVDLLITVGERARMIARGAINGGMNKDQIFSFSSADEAKKFVQDRLEAGDVVLVKGSRGMRMERVVKEIMAEPLRASELLVGY